MYVRFLCTTKEKQANREKCPHKVPHPLLYTVTLTHLFDGHAGADTHTHTHWHTDVEISSTRCEKEKESEPGRDYALIATSVFGALPRWRHLK